MGRALVPQRQLAVVAWAEVAWEAVGTRICPVPAAGEDAGQ